MKERKNWCDLQTALSFNYTLPVMCNLNWLARFKGINTQNRALPAPLEVMWSEFAFPANHQHPKNTIKEKSPHTFAHLVNFSNKCVHIKELEDGYGDSQIRWYGSEIPHHVLFCHFLYSQTIYFTVKPTLAHWAQQILLGSWPQQR